MDGSHSASGRRLPRRCAPRNDHSLDVSLESGEVLAMTTQRIILDRALKACRIKRRTEKTVGAGL